jgi:hypothetical protein
LALCGLFFVLIFALSQSGGIQKATPLSGQAIASRPLWCENNKSFCFHCRFACRVKKIRTQVWEVI